MMGLEILISVEATWMMLDLDVQKAVWVMMISGWLVDQHHMKDV